MLNEIKGLNEECGIFGVFNSPHANQLTYIGLHALQHRGQEGAGIVTVDDDHHFYQHRDRGLLSEVFKDSNDLHRLEGQTAIGHVRYGTSGNNSIANVQPFLFKFNDGDLALAHNGQRKFDERAVVKGPTGKSRRGFPIELRFRSADSFDSSKTFNAVYGRFEAKFK